MFQEGKSLRRNYFQHYAPGMDWKRRLKEAFEATGWSKAELSRRSGVSYDNVTKYLAGLVHQPRGDTLHRLANALGKDPLWLEKGLDLGAPTREVRLMGYIGAGQTVESEPFDQDETVEAPADAHPNTVAAKVRGDSMLPVFRENWIIYWSRHLPPSEMVNQLAVVQLADGRIMVKTLRHGTQPGYWTLSSANARDLVDEIVDWAAPIDWIRPR